MPKLHGVNCDNDHYVVVLFCGVLGIDAILVSIRHVAIAFGTHTNILHHFRRTAVKGRCVAGIKPESTYISGRVRGRACCNECCGSTRGNCLMVHIEAWGRRRNRGTHAISKRSSKASRALWDGRSIARRFTNTRLLEPTGWSLPRVRNREDHCKAISNSSPTSHLVI